MNLWGEGILSDARAGYVLVPIVRGDSPLMMQIVWVKGCLDEGGYLLTEIFKIYIF